MTANRSAELMSRLRGETTLNPWHLRLEAATALEAQAREIERLTTEKKSLVTVLKNYEKDFADERKLKAEIERLRAALDLMDANTTFYDTAESDRPALVSVCKRIWYHATDDQTSYPFSKLFDRTA